jgi:hypothetical protein
MQNLLWGNKDIVYLNALMIQPFQYCSSNCDKCYLKRLKKQFVNSSTHLQVIKEVLFTQKKLITNQLTISMNSLPAKKESSLYKKMMKFWDKLVKLTIKGDGSNFPEIHLTFKDYETYMEYATVIRNTMPNEWSRFRKRITVYTFSNIDIINTLFFNKIKRIKDKVNWNWMPDKSKSIAYQARYGYEVLKGIKSAYLILKKEPLGEIQNTEELIFLIKLYNYMVDNYPDVAHKIHVDNCVQCAINWLNNKKFGCSANISIMHIWPNGHPTGCPYNVLAVPIAPLLTVDKVVEHIKRKRNAYDFDNCKIPEAYQEIKLTK